MPAGPAVAPRGRPGGLALLLRLPEYEIERIFLLVLAGDLEVAEAGAEVVEILAGELAVAREASRAEVDRAVLLIGVALLDQIGDHFDHAVNLLCRERMSGRRADVQAFHVLPALLDISLRNDICSHAFLDSRLDDLVIDVCEIGDVVDLIALVLKIPADGVEDDHGSRISDMNEVVNGRAADVHAYLAGLDRDKFFFVHGECIEDFHGILSFLWDVLFFGK